SECKRIAQGKDPIVWWPSGSKEREQLIEVRKGRFDRESLLKWVEELRNDCDSIAFSNECKLAKELDPNILDKWLVSKRMEQFQQRKKQQFPQNPLKIENQSSSRTEPEIVVRCKKLLSRFGL